MNFEDETKKTKFFLGKEQEAAPKSDAAEHQYNFFRLPKIKPDKTQKSEKPKELNAVAVVSVGEQEKKGESKGWGLAALHAHQCCASQKHPAFVHLEQLLRRGSNLSFHRVSPLNFKEYLLAAKTLASIVQEKSSDVKKRKISRYVAEKKDEEANKQTEAWEEYLHAQKERLFQLRGSSPMK